MTEPAFLRCGRKAGFRLGFGLSSEPAKIIFAVAAVDKGELKNSVTP